MLSQADPFAATWGRAAQLLVPIKSPYYDDPVAWIHDFIKFKPDEGLTFYQEEILSELPRRKRVAVRGPHGLGKTAMEALATLWFAETREANGDDWKTPTLASVWRQLEKYLWPEIHKWERRMDWDKLARQPWRDGRDLLDLNLKLTYGSAFALASDTPDSLEGAHADHLLYVFDESKAIPAGVFDAAEGAFSGSGSDTVVEALALVVSTPGEPSGRFADIHQHRPGTEDWWTRHVTLEEAIAAGRISREWADQRKRQWGETSSIYMNRVLGEFAKQSEDSVIPLSWVEAAVERWKEYMAKVDDGTESLPPLNKIGLDVARSGEDLTVLAARHDRILVEVNRWALASTMKTARTAMNYLHKRNHRYACVDVIGIGAGVVDYMREQGFTIDAFNGSEGSKLTDISGEVEFANRRAASWWTLRELLDPINGAQIMLPDDDMLIGDLVAPKWTITRGGRIQIEDKKEVKKRIGRSPDTGDAVVLAFCPEEPVEWESNEVYVYDEPVVISPY